MALPMQLVAGLGMAGKSAGGQLQAKCATSEPSAVAVRGSERSGRFQAARSPQTCSHSCIRRAGQQEQRESEPPFMLRS